jgi:hypothetical protein
VTAEGLAARVEQLKADRDRLVDLVWHLTNAVELLAQAAGARVPAEAAARARCRAPLGRPRRRRDSGREIQAPARPTPVVCLFCLQVIADESDTDLLERLQAHSCPEGEQQ